MLKKQPKSELKKNGSTFQKAAQEHIEAIKTGVKILLNLKGINLKRKG